MFWAPFTPLGNLFQAGNALSRSLTGRGMVDNFVRDSAAIAGGATVNRINGSSAFRAVNDSWADYYNMQRDAIRQRLASAGFGSSGSGSSGSGSGSQYIYNYSSPRTFEYVNADLAKQYGMNKVTAYNEAMANTAYQRAVADMQQAGLNPASLFSASRASTAGSGYATGGSAHSYSSARGASDEGVPGWLFYGISALANIVATGATKNPSTGFAASNIAKEVMRAVNGMLK